MYRGFTPPTPPASRWINSSSTPITLLGQEPPVPRFPNAHRFIISANYYSDRDFKQLEYVAKFEYQPLLGIWNRPRDTRWKSVKDPVKKTDTVLDRKSTRLNSS